MNRKCSGTFARLRLVLIALLAVVFAAGHVWAQANHGVADPRAIVVSGQTRFTVMTPQLVRMEWAEDSHFEDHASLVFINRLMPVPPFEKREQNGWLEVRTHDLTLRYKEGSGEFTDDNLSVEFKMDGKDVVWHPGDPDTGNLGGTTRTLDGAEGPVPLDPGLVSRNGWVLVDDTKTLLFDESDWPWAIERPAGNRQDWYLFAYGHDYRKALGDYTRVAGKIPLPPRFAFGVWWSRYWAYTDQELEQLVREFREHDVPLDVLVIDMDWHPTFGVRWWENKKDPSGHTLGWTGYTWNPIYFPDPPEFLKWVHRQGLKITLNMHPASGVQPFEAQYPAMARAMGIDPATKQYVPFDIANKKFAENYFKILHHPLEKEGVDFFWLDWQQENTTSLAGLNPTWWLNYTHFTDMEREGKRPLILHRWGGLGNHRYEIGFSGDTISSWKSLAFQPYFSATAANVGYGYWSHDLGGHIVHGPTPPEMFTRWIQFGVFSPIVRTHVTKDPGAERRIWAYPAEYAEVMRKAYVLRYALIPYIYTAAREAYDTGISICHPMYYDYPEAPEAYEYKDEYMFGDDMLVAPITAPMDAESELSAKTIWLPPGEWIEWFTGTRLRGPAVMDRKFSLGQIPVYVKAGAVIPMEPKMLHTGEKPVDPLILTIFPGASGTGRVYDDQGNSPAYKKGKFTWTTIRQSRLTDGSQRIEISPIQGSYPGMLTQRGYEIRLPGTFPPQGVREGSTTIPFSQTAKTLPHWFYDGNTLTTDIFLPRSSVHSIVEVVVTPPKKADEKLLDGVPGEMKRMREAMEMLDTAWPKGWSPDSLIEAAQTGDRIQYRPASARIELEKLAHNVPEVMKAIRAMDVDPGLIKRALAHLGQLSGN
jgi:alpha-glucosidase